MRSPARQAHGADVSGPAPGHGTGFCYRRHKPAQDGGKTLRALPPKKAFALVGPVGAIAMTAVPGALRLALFS